MTPTSGRAALQEFLSKEIPVRFYAPDDLARLHTMDVACFQEPFRFSLRDLKRFLEDRRATTVLAEHGDEIAGFVVVQLQGKVAYIVTLDVGEGYRRAGVGRRLMLEGERLAAEQEAAMMRLHVFVGNKPARQFYASLGYEERRRVLRFYGESLDALVLEKRLEAGPSGDPSRRDASLATAG